MIQSPGLDKDVALCQRLSFSYTCKICLYLAHPDSYQGKRLCKQAQILNRKFPWRLLLFSGHWDECTRRELVTTLLILLDILVWIWRRKAVTGCRAGKREDGDQFETENQGHFVRGITSATRPAWPNTKDGNKYSWWGKLPNGNVCGSREGKGRQQNVDTSLQWQEQSSRLPNQFVVRSKSTT